MGQYYWISRIETTDLCLLSRIENTVNGSASRDRCCWPSFHLLDSASDNLQLPLEVGGGEGRSHLPNTSSGGGADWRQKKAIMQQSAFKQQQYQQVFLFPLRRAFSTRQKLQQ